MKCSAGSGCTSARINGPARPRGLATSRIASSRWTTRQVDHALQAEPFGDFPKLRARGREETTQQPSVAELLDPFLPVLGTATQPLEDPGQFRRDRGFAVAKESPGVFDHLDIAPQREALHHAFAGRIQTAAVFDRTKPQRIFQTSRCLRAGSTAVLRCFQLSGRTLSLDVLEGCLIEEYLLVSGVSRDLGGHRVQIDVNRCRQKRFFIADCDALKACLEKSSASLVLPIGKPRQWFLQALHKPAQALQPLAQSRSTESL